MGTKQLLVVIMLLFSTSAFADDLLDNSYGDNEEEDSILECFRCRISIPHSSSLD